MDHSLVERTKGNIPVSIATSLAIESLLNTHEEIKHPIAPFKENDVIYINIRTLFRNIYNSVDKEHHSRLHYLDIADAMIIEIDTLKDVFKNEAGGLDYQLYFSNYRGLENINQEVLLRLDNTAIQKLYTKKMNQSLGEVLRHYNSALKRASDATNEHVLVFDNKITKVDNRKTIIFTNYPYDLISHRNFNRLRLLESHTGKIKSLDEWYTKYQGGSKLPELPFRLDLLTIFGDNQLFRNKVPAMKKALIQLANDFHWTSITTTSKIKDNIRTINNPVLRERLLNVITGL